MNTSEKTKRKTKGKVESLRLYEIPEELIKYIIEFLNSSKDVHNFGLTHRIFNFILKKKSHDFSTNCEYILKSIHENNFYTRPIKSLKSKKCYVSKLSISITHGVNVLKYFPNLKSLKILRIPCSYLGQCLKHVPKLTSLEINYCIHSMKGKCLIHVPNLKILIMRNCYEFTGKYLIHVPNLTYLEIYNCIHFKVSHVPKSVDLKIIPIVYKSLEHVKFPLNLIN